MKKVLVIGSINMDYVMNVKHMPKVGETILADSLELICGGKGATQAYAVGKLGGDVTMLGAVGDDTNGKTICENLNSVGVDTSKIKICENKDTGIAFICVNSDGDNNITVGTGANAMVEPDYIDENIDIIKQSDIIIMQLEIPIKTVMYTLKKAKEFGKFVILDPAPAKEDLPNEIFKYVDIIKPNETELEILAGEDDLSVVHACKNLIEKGAKTIIATLGKEGCFLYNSDGEKKHFPADKTVKVVDTTAAGDSFTAALALGVAKDMSIEKTITFAGKVSEYVIGIKGAQTSIPTMADLGDIF